MTHPMVKSPLRALAVFTAGLCWGGSLAFLGAPLETAMWFAVAIIAFVTAVCVVLYGAGALHRYKRYRPALSVTCLVCIGLVVGTWLAG